MTSSPLHLPLSFSHHIQNGINRVFSSPLHRVFLYFLSHYAILGCFAIYTHSPWWIFFLLFPHLVHFSCISRALPVGSLAFPIRVCVALYPHPVGLTMGPQWVPSSIVPYAFNLGSPYSFLPIAHASPRAYTLRSLRLPCDCSLLHRASP